MVAWMGSCGEGRGRAKPPRPEPPRLAQNKPVSVPFSPKAKRYRYFFSVDKGRIGNMVSVLLGIKSTDTARVSDPLFRIIFRRYRAYFSTPFRSVRPPGSGTRRPPGSGTRRPPRMAGGGQSLIIGINIFRDEGMPRLVRFHASPNKIRVQKLRDILGFVTFYNPMHAPKLDRRRSFSQKQRYNSERKTVVIPLFFPLSHLNPVF